jgi:hypothetical protein
MTNSSVFAPPQPSTDGKVIHLNPNPFAELWRLGYRRIIPVIPPNAPLMPQSHLAKRVDAGKDPRGKCPGVRWPSGLWSGMDWIKHETTEHDLIRWAAMGANQGVKLGQGLGCFDVDLTNEAHARIVKKLLDERHPGLPVRVGRYPKALYPFRTDLDLPYMRMTVGPQTESGAGDRVEVLSEGKQFVAGGTHPFTRQPFQWPRPLVPFERLPYISRAQVEALLEEIGTLLPEASKVHADRIGNEDAPNQESLRVRSLDALRAAVEATPNDAESFATRESYLAWGYAIKASTAPEQWPETFDIFWDWCARWTGGVNEHDVVEADWLRMRPPFRRGWEWLSTTAEKLSGGRWSRWSEWLEQPQETPESLFGDYGLGDPKDNEQARESGGPLETMAATSLVGIEPPPQGWIVEDWVPAKQVTSWGGPGGDGKSLLLMQLAAATATGTSFLGFAPTEPMKTLFITAEDEKDELLRRLKGLEVSKLDTEPSVYCDNLTLCSLDGEDAVIASASRKDGLLAPTTVFKRLQATIEKIQPELLILDTLADMFGGEENNRVHARQFIGLLRKLVKNYNLTIILIYHPSLSGIQSGSGAAGNTAWRNSVRSSVYQSRIYDQDQQHEPDPDARILQLKKSNRSRGGSELKIRYASGRFELDNDRNKPEAIVTREAQLAELFWTLFDRATAAGREPSCVARSSAYAPPLLKRFDTDGEATVMELEQTMDRLMAAGRLVAVRTGPPSRHRETLRRAEPVDAPHEDSLFD